MLGDQEAYLYFYEKDKQKITSLNFWNLFIVFVFKYIINFL